MAGWDAEEVDDDRAGGGVGSPLAVVGVMERRASVVDDGGVGGFCIGWRGAGTAAAAVDVGGCINGCCSTGYGTTGSVGNERPRLA